MFLTPEKGNIHSIVALENAILVDILLPGYSEGHLSTYYEEVAANYDIKNVTGEETKGYSVVKEKKGSNNNGSDIEDSIENNEEENRHNDRKPVLLKPIADPDEMRVRIIRNPEVEIHGFDKLE